MQSIEMLTTDGTYKPIHIYRNSNLRRTKIMGTKFYVFGARWMCVVSLSLPQN